MELISIAIGDFQQMMKYYLVIKVSGYVVHKVSSLFAMALSFTGQHRKCKIIGDEAFRIVRIKLFTLQA